MPQFINLKGIYPPENGWKAKSHYIIEVKFFKTNLPHRKLFYTGFLDNEGRPGSYSWIINSSKRFTIDDAYYMKVIEEIDLKGAKTV